MSKPPPKVFISYSHDSPEHKKWVIGFALMLREKGIDIILDHWKLQPGDDIGKFMEKSIAEADSVLMICTEAYVRKADGGRGGVGYEVMVVTGELMKDLEVTRFIPIIRQTDGQIQLPICVRTRLGVDFSEGRDTHAALEDLLRKLHDVPRAPETPIGPNPFELKLTRATQEEFAEAEVGKIYRSKVITIKEFGVFVEFLPGKDGLVHISELANFRVKDPKDIVKIGDEFFVKCLGVDEKGRVRLSRRAAMMEQDSVAEGRNSKAGGDPSGDHRGETGMSIETPGRMQGPSRSALNQAGLSPDSHAPLDPSLLYDRAHDIVRQGDLVLWRRLIKETRQHIPRRLSEWQRAAAIRPVPDNENLPALVLEAATICAPLLSVALAGVESARGEFNNQASLIDDLIAPQGWIGSGLVELVEIPDTMVFMYQALHGAVCVESNQLILALQLASSRVRRPHETQSIILFHDQKLIGWPDSLGANCVTAWQFLSTLANKWTWLLRIFGNINDYQAALCAYYLALNIQELVEIISARKERVLQSHALSMVVPLCNHSFSLDIRRKAYQLLIRQERNIRLIWRKHGITDGKMAEHWPAWIEHCKGWLGRNYGSGLLGKIAHEDFFRDLPPET